MGSGVRWLAFGFGVVGGAASCALETGGLLVAPDDGRSDASIAEARAPTFETGGEVDALLGGDDDAAVVVDGAPDSIAQEATDGVDAADARLVDSGIDSSADSAVDSGVPGTIVSLAVVGPTVDKVSSSDQGLATDGNVDGTFVMSVEGPIDGLILVSTNGSGATSGNSQWDTLVLTDVIPSIGASFTTGGQTWILGVFEGLSRVNDATGRINLGVGLHAVSLYASNNGSQATGQHFRVYAHAPGGQWRAGPVVKW